jgi:hypothetical protein
MKAACLLPLVMLAAAPASAQGATPFETTATTAAGPCLAIQVSPETALAVIAACDKLVGDIAVLSQANSPLSGHDLNVSSIVASMAHSRVANSYGKIDGVRSARVCQRMEMSWTESSKLDPSASPAYAPMIKDLVQGAISTVSKCRGEFGTPAGAAAVPAG